MGMIAWDLGAGFSFPERVRNPRFTVRCEYPDTGMAPTEVTFGLSPRCGIHTARETQDWFLEMMQGRVVRVPATLILVHYAASSGSLIAVNRVHLTKHRDVQFLGLAQLPSQGLEACPSAVHHQRGFPETVDKLLGYQHALAALRQCGAYLMRRIV